MKTILVVILALLAYNSQGTLGSNLGPLQFAVSLKSVRSDWELRQVVRPPSRTTEPLPNPPAPLEVP